MSERILAVRREAAGAPDVSVLEMATRRIQRMSANVQCGLVTQTIQNAWSPFLRLM
jgi:hypothetical protein